MIRVVFLALSLVCSAAADALNGIDVLKREGFKPLAGLKVGLVTNHTGRDRDGASTIDLLHAAPDVRLVALFSPEHGIRGELDQAEIRDTKDERTGLPVHSLYGERRSPDPARLAGLDALVFDIQDIGCRFYTYISTLTLCMEQAALADIRFIVLDRVNPIGGAVEGPVLAAPRSFVATHEIPLRHGMTVGELAGLINAERKFRAKLEVIRCENWTPALWFDETGLPWRNPSPNMRSLTAATLYPGVGLLEFCNVSVGRGTDTPFELLGAPYIDGASLAAELERVRPSGVKFEAVRFTPASSVHAGKECGGVRFILTDRERFRCVDLGVALALILHRLHADELGLAKMDRLLGHPPTLDAIRKNKALPEIHALWADGLEDFQKRRRAFLLYERR